MKKILLISIFLFLHFGCTSNPYSESQKTIDDQAQKNPQQAEFIRQQQKEWEIQKQMRPSLDDKYSVEQEKISGFALGGPNAAFHLGSNTYQYHHKINLTLVCDKDTFIPKPYRQKNVKWKLNESLSGVAQSSNDGKVHIYFKNEVDQRFRNLILQTSKNSYEILLNDINPMIELKKEDCY